MITTTQDASTRSIAEYLLETLRLLDRADNQRLAAQHGGAYGDVREALIKVLAEESWGRGMADEAIYLAMDSHISIADAMMATRTGYQTNTIVEVTDEITQQIADAIGKHFNADRDYWPKVMPSDWDGEAGRVIVWDNMPDWTFLACWGGYDEGCDCPSIPLPAGVWVEAINPQALRVLRS
ncbi:hypothetical protein ABZ470_26690 [Streptosporangium sp. NPDC020072]|uniref:hypothetical protein n=1 Tax=Streptosporangium sp. NPDC020072 TaxID=3154788 RepID=UPI00342A1671